MAKGTLFVGWGSIIPGRERAAQRSLLDALQYCMRLQAEDRIDSFEAVALEPHGGDLAGFVLVRGDRDSIAQLRVDDEFVRVIVGVQLVHNNVGVVGAYTGVEMEALFAMWDEQEDKFA